MTRPILALARETLALADGATSGPWRAHSDAPIPGTAVADCGRSPDNDRNWIRAEGGRRGNATQDARFIAHGRTAAPELARFVELANKVTAEMWMEAATEQAYESDDESEAMCILSDLRRLLGLPPLIDAAGRRLGLGLDTTEGGR